MKKMYNTAIKITAVFPVLLFAIIGFSLSIANAEEDKEDPGKPLWEVGLIPGAIRLPHYRGSDEYNVWTLPLPYLIYRGKLLQLDREGFRGIFYRSDHFQTSISGWGNPPVDEDNDARDGMSIPDAVLEIGPSIQWHFNGRHPNRTLYLRGAIRSVISVGFPDDSDIAYRGLKSAVNLVYQREAFWGNHRWHLGLNSGIEFGDRKYHRYFYEVPLADARPDRPAYFPDKGISAFILSLGLIREINKRVSIAGYTRWENLSRAVYKSSPLVREENNFIIGGALIWTIRQSETRVHSDE